MAKDKKETKKKVAVDAKVEFQFRNATKGAIRFQEVDDDGNVVEDEHAIGALYIRKQFLENIGFDREPSGCTVSITIR